MKLNVVIFLFLVTLGYCNCQRHPTKQNKNVKQKVSNIIGNIRNIKLSYNPNKNNRRLTNKRPFLTTSSAQQRHWPNVQQGRFNRDSPPPPQQQQQQYQQEQPEPQSYIQNEPEILPPLQQGYTESNPPPPEYSNIIPEETPSPPSPTYVEEPVPVSEPSPYEQPSSVKVYKFKLLDAITTEQSSVPVYGQREPVQTPVYTQPAPVSSPIYNQPEPASSPIYNQPEPVFSSVYIKSEPTSSPVYIKSEAASAPANNPPEPVSSPVYTKSESVSSPVYTKSEPVSSPVYNQPEPVQSPAKPSQQLPYSQRGFQAQGSEFNQGKVFPNVITKSIAEFASTIDKDAIGNISPFSYFKNGVVGPRVVYPLDEVAQEEPEASPPPNIVPYTPTVTLINTNVPQNYQSDTPSPLSYNLTPSVSTITQAQYGYTPYPPLATPPPPVPEVALHADYNNNDNNTPEIAEPNETGSLNVYRWRQVDQTGNGNAYPSEQQPQNEISQTQPELFYNNIAQESSNEIDTKKKRQNYVPTFISSSSSQQPQQPEQPVDQAASEENPAPIFYFKDIVEEDTVSAAEPESPPPQEEPAAVTYHPPAPVAPPTASPIYYKPVEVPAPAPETAPEPVYQPEPPPQEPEPTPSPPYYKTPDSPAPPPAVPQEATADYDKLKTVGENEFGFPSQNFVNQDNFKIPEFFRTFLNTPPKWINMNNW